MSEQAQATSTTGADAARATTRRRPSRAKGAASTAQAKPARPNGVAKPKSAGEQRPGVTEAARPAADPRGPGEGTNLYEAGRAAALEEVRQREESVRQEAERTEAAARETAAREATEQETARVQQLVADYQGLMNVASAAFNHVSAAVAEISATLTWEPSKGATVDHAIRKAAQGLVHFQTYLTRARSLGAEQHLRAEDPDVGGSFLLVLEAHRELRRRIDAQISILETDFGNVPALLAMERAIAEQGLLVTVMSRGFGRMLEQEKLAR